MFLEFHPGLVVPYSRAMGVPLIRTNVDTQESYRNPYQLNSSNLLSTSSTLVRRESITVPAGTFANACVIELANEITLSTNRSYTFTTTTWIVPDVGFVALQSTTIGRIGGVAQPPIIEKFALRAMQ